MKKNGYANSFEFDPKKPLTIPYGKYPHKKSGKVQVVDSKSATAFKAQIQAAKEAGAPGLPIYSGHPDVPDLASRYPDKGAKGWVTDCMNGGDHCKMPTEWNDEPKPGAFVYFSPYFFGDETTDPDVHIDECQSIGLTNRPNSTRFRLPNEEAAVDSNPNPEPRTSSMKKVLKLLGLAETATEDDAAAKLQGLMDGHATALKRQGEEHTAALAFANEEATKNKTAFENERNARVDLLLDCALSAGKVTPATKPVWAKRLRADFANESVALANAGMEVKTKSVGLPNEAGDHSPAGILAQYEAMPKGKARQAFLRDHAEEINAARSATKV